MFNESLSFKLSNSLSSVVFIPSKFPLYQSLKGIKDSLTLIIMD